MPETEQGSLPIIYVRGYAGSSSAIDEAADDPFCGFNLGSTHVRVDQDEKPYYYQFEGPLLRLVTEKGYTALAYGDQLAWLHGQPDGSVEPARIWVHRFYDAAASTFGREPREYSLEKAAEDLFTLVNLVRQKTRGAPRVLLVAHSMGGLICRSMLQRVIPDADGELDAATRYVERLFTYATPHGGITFDVGGGLIEKVRDLAGVAGADIFGPKRMHEYLTPDTGKLRRKVPDEDEFRATEMPAEGFPVSRVFCVVGTNPADYGVASGMVAHTVGPQSDGLVRIENAQVTGAPRAFVHRSHSGRYGVVNSEEGYQNLRRFLFGDVRVGLRLAGLAVDRSDPDVSWQLEVAVAIRGYPVRVYEQTTDHFCPIVLPPEATELDLLTTFLDTGAPRPADRRTEQPVSSMRHVVSLRLLSLLHRNGFMNFNDHVEQAEEWKDLLVVDMLPGAPGEAALVAATWNSRINGAIRTWAPADGDFVADREPPLDLWRGQIPLPEQVHPILGPSSAVELVVRPWRISPPDPGQAEA